MIKEAFIQWSVAALVIFVVIWLIKENRKTVKEDRQWQADEAEKQRNWNQEQEKKRDEFQEKLTKNNQEFIEKLQQDQAKNSQVLDQSIKVLTGKTDLMLSKIDQHHAYLEKEVSRVTKRQGAVDVVMGDK